MKRLFITVLLLIPCLGPIIANQFYVHYKDSNTWVCYNSSYSTTHFQIMQDNDNNECVCDESYLDESKRHTKEDYERIYNEINTNHPDVIMEYKNITNGEFARIKFYKEKAELDYQPKINR